MKSVFAILALAFVALGACDNPSPAYVRKHDPAAAAAADAAKAAASGPKRERPGPAVWSEARRAFAYNGQPVRAARLFDFDGSTDGFTGVGAEVTPASPFGARVTDFTPDPILRSGQGLAVDGARNTLVLVRLTRTKPGGLWSGALFYTTPGHAEAEAFRALPTDRRDIGVNETVTLVYDLAASPAAADWTTSQIDQIRLDLDDATGGEFILRQVAIGAVAP